MNDAIPDNVEVLQRLVRGLADALSDTGYCRVLDIQEHEGWAGILKIGDDLEEYAQEQLGQGVLLSRDLLEFLKTYPDFEYTKSLNYE